jgi:prepilin-type processing-associated H-X9-DG protein
MGGIYIALPNTPAVTVASVTDGTSNTFAFSERTVPSSAVEVPLPWNTSGYNLYFTTQVPPNYTTNTINFADRPYASSAHPGGLNVGFADGSVRFIKSSVSSWPIEKHGYLNPSYYTISLSNGIQTWSVNAGAPIGVWQTLSTKAGGEVISSDSY